jgi:riboflavin kinase/FMN adenylyltransferase
VLTFENHPLCVLNPEECPPLIMDRRRKVEVLGRLGVDDVIAIRFDREFASLTAERFITEVLRSCLSVRTVVCSESFRFGDKAAGTPDLLRSLGGPLGIRAEVVELVRDAGVIASSTAVRSLLADGDVEEAARLLGDVFVLSGTVQPGARRGAALGYPTANVSIAEGLLVPGDGVYACLAGCADDPTWRGAAAVSIGDRPTFGGGDTVIEAYLIGYTGRDLYGEELTLSFSRRLRGQRRYDRTDDLIRQMHDDVEAVRQALAGSTAGLAPHAGACG